MTGLTTQLSADGHDVEYNTDVYGTDVYGNGASAESGYEVSNATQLNRIAATDATFRRESDDWTGKCLICGGPLRFSARTGDGATVEHILPRSLGGTNDLRNLGIAHPRCNGEKGKHWDPRRRHRARLAEYQALVGRLHAERERRWRDGEPEVARSGMVGQ